MLRSNMAAPSANTCSAAVVAKIYSYEGMTYEIMDTEEVQIKLASDSEFFTNYMKKNIPEFPVVNSASLCEPHVEINCERNETLPETFAWSPSLNKLLLHEYLARKDKFRNPKIKKRLLWRDIVSVFKEKGYNVSEDVLDSKMRNMKKTYKTIKNSKASTGRERIIWSHYEAMEEIFNDDKTVNPGYTVSSFLPVIPGTSSIEPPPPTSSNSSPVQPSPSTSTTHVSADALDNQMEDLPELCEKAMRGRKLYGLRKQQLQVEKDHIEAINKLTRAIESSNEIQRERNRILQSLVDK